MLSFSHFMLQDLDAASNRRLPGLRWHDVTFERGGGSLIPNASDCSKRDSSESKSIGQLAGNPLLLTMMAILNRHQELPRDRTELYQQCARLLLLQWETDKALEGLSRAWTWTGGLPGKDGHPAQRGLGAMQTAGYPTGPAATSSTARRWKA